MTLKLHSKRNQLIVILTALLAGSLLLIGAKKLQAPQAEEMLLTYNGQEATAAEFNWHLQMNRALIVDYFKQTYNADYSIDFWSAYYSGENPMQKWINTAQTQLLTKRMELQLAQEAGVVTDISFEGFLKEMERENNRRSQAAANKEVVYGPLHLEAQAYFNYYMSNLEDATIEAMRSNGSIVISDEQVKLEYAANLISAGNDSSGMGNASLWPRNRVQRSAKSLRKNGKAPCNSNSDSSNRFFRHRLPRPGKRVWRKRWRGENNKCFTANSSSGKSKGIAYRRATGAGRV